MHARKITLDDGSNLQSGNSELIEKESEFSPLLFVNETVNCMRRTSYEIF